MHLTVIMTDLLVLMIMALRKSLKLISKVIQAMPLFYVEGDDAMPYLPRLALFMIRYVVSLLILVLVQTLLPQRLLKNYVL